jgi:hypothetical protein
MQDSPLLIALKSFVQELPSEYKNVTKTFILKGWRIKIQSLSVDFPLYHYGEIGDNPQFTGKINNVSVSLYYNSLDQILKLTVFCQEKDKNTQVTVTGKILSDFQKPVRFVVKNEIYVFYYKK